MGAASFELSLVDKVSGPAAKISSSLSDVVNKADGAQGSTASLGDIFKGLADGSMSAGDALGALTKLIDPYALAAAAAVAVTTALAAALAAGFQEAIAATQAKQAAVSMFDALTGAGQQTVDMLEDLSTKLPFTTDQLSEMAKPLAAAGYAGDGLADAVRAVSAATAIMGQEGGAAASKFLSQLEEGGAAAAKLVKSVQAGGPKSAKLLQQMGLQAQDLADALGVAPDQLAKMQLSAEQLGGALERALAERGAGSLERLSLSWATIKAKVAEGFGDAFEDMGAAVTPFMEAVKGLAGEFFKGSTASGAFKGIVESVFSSLLTFATMVVREAHLMFLELEIGFLKAKILAAPLVSAISAVTSALGGWGLLMPVVKGLLIGVGAIVVVVAGVVLALGETFALIGAAVYAAVYPFIWFGEQVAAVVGGVVDLWNSLAGLLSGTDFSGVVDNLITTLVDGITNGASAVLAAVTNLGKGIVTAAKNALGIHSPSRPFSEMADNVTGTFTGRVEAANDNAIAAGEKFAGGTVRGAAVGLSGASARGGAGGITIGTINVVVYGAGGDAMELTEEALADVLERLAIQKGLAA